MKHPEMTKEQEQNLNETMELLRGANEAQRKYWCKCALKSDKAGMNVNVYDENVWNSLASAKGESP